MKINNKNKTKMRINFKSLRIYVLGGICGILAIASIFMAIESATSGAEVASLQKKQAELLNQQQDLQESLVENLSVNSLQEKSAEMGFTKTNTLVYVAESIPVAGLSGFEIGR